jgi:hypothetical protein
VTKTTTKPKDVVRQADLRWVPIPDMRPAPAFEAQRELRETRVEHLVANFDLEEMGTPTVSLRDGIFWIIDGNHRIEALKRLGFGEDRVECWVYEGLTAQQESERFLKLNDYLTVDVLTKFRVGVRAGRQPEVAINNVVIRAGAKVTRDKNVPNYIMAVGALRKIHEAAGEAGLERTLVVLREAFGQHGFESLAIQGVGLVIARYGDEVDDVHLIKRLSATSRGVKGLIQKGNEYWYGTGNPKTTCTAAAVVDIYNVGRKGAERLPKWWR